LRFLLVAVAALVFAGAASADTTFTDATGENAAAADISTVTVSNDPAAKTITFKEQITNMPTLTEDNAAIEIYFDADHNVTTGRNVGVGVDCYFGVDKDGFYFMKWDGTKFTQVTGLGLLVSYANGLLSVTLHESDCSFGPTFDFWSTSYRGPDINNPVLDDAPDGSGVYAYTLATAPVAKPPVVRGTTVTATVAKAGAKFRVGPFQVKLSDGTMLNATGVKCTATLGGAKLKGAGAGGCTFALPKTAKKKRLVVKVSGVYNGATLSKSVTYIVK